MTAPVSSSLEIYLENLVRESHAEAPLEDYMVRDMKADLLPRLNRFIVLKTMEELALKSPEILKEFQALVFEKQASQKEVQEFIRNKVPQEAVFLTKVLLEFRNTYLGLRANRT